MVDQAKLRHNPFSGIVDFFTDMNRMSDRMRGFDSSGEKEARSHINAWTPSVDIAAVQDQLVILAELPGVADEDVEVAYTAPTLVIAGCRRLQEGESQEHEYHTKELSWGQFRRNITLPDGVHREDMTVTLNRGLLRITVHRYNQSDGPSVLKVNR